MHGTLTTKANRNTKIAPRPPSWRRRIGNQEISRSPNIRKEPEIKGFKLWGWPEPRRKAQREQPPTQQRTTHRLTTQESTNQHKKTWIWIKPSSQRQNTAMQSWPRQMNNEGNIPRMMFELRNRVTLMWTLHMNFTLFLFVR